MAKKKVVFDSRVAKRYVQDKVEVPIQLTEKELNGLVKAYEYAKRNGNTEMRTLESFASEIVEKYLKEEETEKEKKS